MTLVVLPVGFAPSPSGAFFFSLSPTRIGELAVLTRSCMAFAPSGAFSSNTPERLTIHSLGSEANGEAHVLPTPGRFAGLENREVVIAKPCTFLFDRCFENTPIFFASSGLMRFLSVLNMRSVSQARMRKPKEKGE